MSSCIDVAIPWGYIDHTGVWRPTPVHVHITPTNLPRQYNPGPDSDLRGVIAALMKAVLL